MADQDPNDLRVRIEKAKAAHGAKTKPDKIQEQTNAVSAGGLALRYGAEFGASVFVGIVFGLLIDHFFGTKPWGLLIMLAFGLAAGILNVVRAYRMLTAQATGETDGPQMKKDEKNEQ